MAKLPVACVDICNTLADVNTVIKQELGFRPTPGSYIIPGATEDFFRKNLWIFKEAKPLPDSCEALRKLSLYYKVIYVTARPLEAGCITKKWLKLNEYPEGVIFHTRQKGKLATILGARLAIDDAPHEILSYISYGIPVLVKSQDYNGQFQRRFEWDSVRDSGLALV